MEEVACRREPELWFSPVPGDVARAKSVCAECPVRAHCLAFAVNTGQDFGVWGGLDADERRLLRRRRLERQLAPTR